MATHALAMAALPEARMQTVKNLRHSVGAFGFYRQPSVFFCRNSSIRVIKLSENIQRSGIVVRWKSEGPEQL